MVDKVDIANLALNILGKSTIASFLDNSNSARTMNIEYDPIRQQLLRGPGTWRFSIKRASLPASATVPASGPYNQCFPKPADCLRILMAGDTYPGNDISDYRMGPIGSDYSLEGNLILCNQGAPLSLRYVGDITDAGLFDPNFVIALAAELAWTACERLTGSDAKREEAKKRKEIAYQQAAASNAMENVPEYQADNSWVLARQQ